MWREHSDRHRGQRALLVKLSMCDDQKKKMYPTKSAAIRAALSFSRKRGTPLRVYWHSECKSFHLSSQARFIAPRVDIHTERSSA